MIRTIIFLIIIFGVLIISSFSKKFLKFNTLFLIVFAFSYGGIKMYFLNSQIVTLIFILYSLFIIFLIIQHKFVKINPRSEKLIYVLIGIYLLSSIYTQGTYFAAFRGLLIFPIFFIFIYMGKFLIKYKYYESVAKVIIFISVVSVLFALKQFFLGYTGIEQSFVETSSANYSVNYGIINIPRAFGLQGGPSDYSSALLFPILWLVISKDMNKYIRFPVMILLVIGQIISLTRGPIFALILSLLLLMLLEKKVLLIISSMIMFTLFYSYSLSELIPNEKLSKTVYRMEKMRSPLEISSIESRFLSWGTYFNKLKMEPIRIIFGHGPGTSGVVSTMSKKSLKIDNSYLKILHEVGLIGLIILIMLHLKLFKLLLPYVKGASARDPILIKFLILMNFSFLLIFFTTEYLELYPIKIIYFLVIGATLEITKNNPKPTLVRPN